MNVLDIDVTLEGTKQIRIIWDHPTVIDNIFDVLVPNLASISPLSRASASVVRILVVINYSIRRELLGEPSLACPICTALATPQMSPVV